MHSPAEARRAGLVSVYQEPALIPDLDVAANLRLTETPVEPFRSWVRELGVPDLDLRETARQHPARRPARARPRPGAGDRAGCAAARRDDGGAAGRSRRKGPRRRRRPDRDRPFGDLHLPPAAGDLGALRPRHGAARRRDRGRGRHGAPAPRSRSWSSCSAPPWKTSRRARSARQRRVRRTSAASRDAPRLRVRNLRVGTKLEDVSFDLLAGEVLGVVALEGQGQDELFGVLSGSAALGRPMEVDGKARPLRPPRRRDRGRDSSTCRATAPRPF